MSNQGPILAFNQHQQEFHLLSVDNVVHGMCHDEIIVAIDIGNEMFHFSTKVER